MANKKKLIFKKFKKTIWHPESRLVFKSINERIVIGKLNKNKELLDLDEECLDLCEKWNFVPDSSLIEIDEQETEDTHEKQETEDTHEKQETEDTHEEQETEDTHEEQETEDTHEDQETKDTHEDQETKDTHEDQETEDTHEDQETEDTHEDQETQNTPEEETETKNEYILNVKKITSHLLFDVKTVINNLEETIFKMSDENTKLTKCLDKRNQEYDDLQERYNNLQEKYDKMDNKFKALKNLFN